jgi:hypothetical protein
MVLQSSANPQFLFVPRAGLRVSLSPGERAGVRGNETSFGTIAALILGSGAHSAQKLLGILSPLRGEGEYTCASKTFAAIHGELAEPS